MCYVFLSETSCIVRLCSTHDRLFKCFSKLFLYTRHYLDVMPGILELKRYLNPLKFVCSLLLGYVFAKAFSVSTNSWRGCTVTSHGAQWAFLKRRQQCWTLKEAEECSRVTFLIVHASYRLMMSCYVSLSCLLSPER